MKIATSILSADLMNMQRDIEKAENAGADLIHIDIMDGHFVNNISFGLRIIRDVKKISRVPLDVHLMIEHPEPYLDTIIGYGADMVMIHAEGTPHTYGAIQKIHELGAKAGIVLNPGTPVSSILPILPIVDQVLIMTVNPGFGGQKFIPEMTDKIRKLDQLNQTRPDCHFDIEVDGGIDNETIKICKNAGANVFVSGSYIFHSNDIEGRVKSLRVE